MFGDSQMCQPMISQIYLVQNCTLLTSDYGIHHGSSLNNQLNKNHHYTSTSLTIRKCLTVWIGELYGTFIDTTAVPKKIVNITRNSSDRLHCKVMHGGQLIDRFQMKIGVRQVCSLPRFLHLMVGWNYGDHHI